MEDVCCPANRVAISMPVISSSLRYLPPYTCSHAVGIKLTIQHDRQQTCQQRARSIAEQQQDGGAERRRGSGDLRPSRSASQ